MAYLITGGTGLIGSFLLEMLANKIDDSNKECRVIVRSERDLLKVKKLGFFPVKTDLNDQSGLNNAIKDVDAVLNLAALANDEANWDELYRVNVLGMRNLINACLMSNSNPFLVHVSSTGVYGHYIPSFPIDESYKFNPTSIYQKSKFYQEKELWEMNNTEGWENFAIIRPPSVIGPRDTKTILRIFKYIYEGKFPILHGGKQYLTFIHPYDVSQALLLIEKNQKKTKSHAFNLKSFECSFSDFLNYITEKINPPSPQKNRNYHLVYTIAVLSEIYSKITGKPTYLNRYRVTKFARTRRYDDSKIRNLIGFVPQKTMEQTIDESYEWLVDKGLFPST